MPHPLSFRLPLLPRACGLLSATVVWDISNRWLSRPPNNSRSHRGPSLWLFLGRGGVGILDRAGRVRHILDRARLIRRFRFDRQALVRRFRLGLRGLCRAHLRSTRGDENSSGRCSRFICQGSAGGVWQLLASSLLSTGNSVLRLGSSTSAT